MLSPDTLLSIAIGFAIALPAIILHEVAHGYVAYLLGDTTAKERGRLSLNPVRHIDPWGTILLPLLLLAVTQGRAVFGYAKPVPVNHYRFRDPQHGMLLVGLAGPGANLLLGIVSGLILRFVGPMLPDTTVGQLVVEVMFRFAYINFVLMFFNLIPIPPLDGSRVVQRFLRGSALQFWYNLERYGFIILFAVLYLVPSVLDTYLRWTVQPLLRLILGA